MWMTFAANDRLPVMDRRSLLLLVLRSSHLSFIQQHVDLAEFGFGQTHLPGGSVQLDTQESQGGRGGGGQALSTLIQMGYSACQKKQAKS